jgi:hypothetical protein
LERNPTAFRPKIHTSPFTANKGRGNANTRQVNPLVLSMLGDVVLLC